MAADYNEIFRLLTSGKPDNIQKLVDETHPADVLQAVQDIGDEDYRYLLVLPDDYLADVIDEAEDDDKYEILKVIDPGRIGSVLNRMSVDEIADLIRELEDDNKDAVGKSLLRGRTKTDVTKLLKYDEETAGGIMTTQFIAIYASNTVMRALNYLKTEVNAETSWYLYVVDKVTYKLMGVVSLRDLVMAPFDTLISDIMNDNVISVRTDLDQEAVARLFTKYGYAALPVVDENGKMVGIVTVDDVIDVINEEATEDIHRMGGIDKEEKIDGSVKDAVRSRLPWLVVNLATAILASSVIAKFNGTISQIVALSAVMTIISGMGGNAGTQSLTIVVRALSLNEIDKENGLRILAKEIVTGFRTLAQRRGLWLVEAELLTGRTHQIRAHLAFLGAPILGDLKYGSAKLSKKYEESRQLLCAHAIELRPEPDADPLLADLAGRRFVRARVDFVDRYFPDVRLG